jgi:uncharacterized protein (DUF2236 family)
MWVLYSLVDSGMVVYDMYVRGLDDAERAALWDDFKVVGRLFGLRRRDMPVTLADFREYGRAMLAGGTLAVTPWARTRAREIVLDPPVPLVAEPLVETVNFITIALLPEPIRSQYGFSALPPAWLRRLVVAGGAEYVKRFVVPFLPGRVRLVPSARAA